MDKPVVVIISGPPCSGKTTLGCIIAQAFSLPFFNKDGVKEALFEHLGWGGRPWSKTLSQASYHILYQFVAAQLAAGRSFVIEANFSCDPHSERLRMMQAQSDFQPVQIQCVTQGAVLAERFEQRATSGQRHPGHVDQLTYAEIEPVLLAGRLEPLRLDGPLIEVDTTHLDLVDYQAIIDTLTPYFE